VSPARARARSPEAAGGVKRSFVMTICLSIPGAAEKVQSFFAAARQVRLDGNTQHSTFNSQHRSNAGIAREMTV